MGGGGRHNVEWARKGSGARKNFGRRVNVIKIHEILKELIYFLKEETKIKTLGKY